MYSQRRQQGFGCNTFRDVIGVNREEGSVRRSAVFARQ
jgi:hypothetical protein